MFLFSLQAAKHSPTFMMELFSKKKLTAKSRYLFLQRSSIIDFWLGSKYGSCQYCQKSSCLKDIPPVLQNFLFLYYHVYFILSHKFEKSLTERNKRLDIWSLFIDWGNQFLILADWIIENDLCKILCVVLEFLIKRRGFVLFFAACLIQTQ